MTLNPLVYQLGNPRSEHRPTVMVWLTIVLGLILTLAAFGLFIGVLPRNTPVELRSAAMVASIPLMVGSGMLAMGYRHFRERVQIFDQGLVYTRGAATLAWRWEEIAYVWQEIATIRVNFIPVKTVHTYTVQHRDGRKIKLTNGLRAIKALGAALQSETFKHLMPQARAAYNRGETLHFGKLQLSQAGIGNGKETLPWSQIKGVAVNQGYISIQKAGKWLRWSNAAVAKVPNFFIFMALVEQITGRR